MIDGKRGGEWCSIQSVQRRRGTGKGQREGGEAAHRGGGDIGGGERRQEQGWKAGRKARRGEKVRRVGVVWVQLLARAYIYSCYI